MTEEEIREKELIEAAMEARGRSYSPYSGYRVGAALRTGGGRIYTGCNIENASYSATVCAERTALFKAVSEGERDFKAIAIAGGKDKEETELSDYAFPCGICRQALSEFCPGELRIMVARSVSDYKKYTLKELLPESFGADKL